MNKLGFLLIPFFFLSRLVGKKKRGSDVLTPNEADEQAGNVAHEGFRDECFLTEDH